MAHLGRSTDGFQSTRKDASVCASSIPELIEGCPTPPNRTIFAVIRGIVNQLQAPLMLASQADHPLDKLPAMRASRTTTIEVNCQRDDVSIFNPSLLPPMVPAIDNEVRGFGGFPQIEGKRVRVAIENAKGRCVTS